MKRLFVVAVSMLGLALSPGSAYAAGAFTGTAHITSLHDAIPITCAGAFTGLTFRDATGNGVMHLTVNGTGDWFTTTFEGQGTIVQTAGPYAGKVFQGHLVDWFGSEDNLQNNVQHATFNFQGANVADPSQTLAMHAAFDVTTNATGSVTVQNITVSCS